MVLNWIIFTDRRSTIFTRNEAVDDWNLGRSVYIADANSLIDGKSIGHCEGPYGTAKDPLTDEGAETTYLSDK